MRKPPISIIVGIVLIVLGVFALSWAYNIWERINFLEILISTPFMMAAFEMELEIRVLQPQLTFAVEMGIALLACGITLIIGRKWLPSLMVLLLVVLLFSQVSSVQAKLGMNRSRASVPRGVYVWANTTVTVRQQEVRGSTSAWIAHLLGAYHPVTLEFLEVGYYVNASGYFLYWSFYNKNNASRPIVGFFATTSIGSQYTFQVQSVGRDAWVFLNMNFVMSYVFSVDTGIRFAVQAETFNWGDENLVDGYFDDLQVARPKQPQSQSIEPAQLYQDVDVTHWLRRETLVEYGSYPLMLIFDGDWVIAARIYGNPGGGGNECPYVSTWNGSNYVLDNNILPTSERSNGTDVEDYYKLEQALLPRDGQYSLLISEFEHEHSYIDQVRLLAVDHDSDIKIAIDPNGQILTYKNPTVPISAVDNYGNNRLNEIRHMDGDVSDPPTFFYGNASDYLVFNFGRVSSDNAKLILRDDMKSDEVCIDVQVLNRYEQWQTVTTVTPRSYWAVEGVDLSSYVIKNRDFKVRLLWTSPHRLDYAGLDTTRQANYQITYATLFSATHSTRGDVTTLLTADDNTYAELIPGQQIQIDFTLPDNRRQARTYILHTEGHYVIP